MRTFAALLETTLPWSGSAEEIGTALKVALLRTPTLAISDTQAIDNGALQQLLGNEQFQRLIREPSSGYPAFEVGSRGLSYQAVLEEWLDIAGRRAHPTQLSGLSDSVNRVIEHAHDERTLTLQAFQEIAPKYYEHVMALGTRIPRTFSFRLGHDSFKAKVLQTMDEFVSTYPESELLPVLESLRARWEPLHDPTRDQLLRDINELAQQGVASKEQAGWVSGGILSFAYQRNFARVADTRIVAGRESSSWIAPKTEARIQSVSRVIVEVPRNPFVTELTWQGVKSVRDDPDFMGSMVALASASEQAYPQAVAEYIDNLTRAYAYAVDEGFAPSPFRRHEAVVRTVAYEGVGAGALLGGIVGRTIGADDVGILTGAVVGNWVGDANASRTRGLLMKHDIFAPSPEFRQIYGDLQR